MWTWWGWGVCGEQKAIFSQFFPPQGPGSKSSVHPDSKCFTYRTPTPFQHSPALYSRRLILRRGLIFFFRLVLNLLGLGFWPSCLKFLSIRDYGLLSSGLCLQFFISTHLELCVCVGGVSSAKVHIWRSFCSCYSISFVEDCRCLVHHYSNSTIIKSEEGLRLLSTRMTGIHRYTRLLFLYHTFRIQPIQLSTEVESCV